MASTAAKADAVREEYEEACNKVETIKVRRKRINTKKVIPPITKLGRGVYWNLCACVHIFVCLDFVQVISSEPLKLL